MKQYLSTFTLFFIATLQTLLGNSDVRDWIFEDGQRTRAELISYDEVTGNVLLKFNDVEDRTYQFNDFGIIDQAWLVEWIEFEENLQIQLDELGGSFEHIVTTGNTPTDLFIYYPSAEETASKPLPALILFHPGGKAARYCMRHMEAAEATGLVIIACGTFRNTDDNFELESTLLERFREVFPQILTKVRLDPNQIFMGGTSGGSWRAFHYSAWINHPWAGIYSNVGWLGGKKYYHLPYPSDMRVVMINGNQDRAANGSVGPDSQLLIKAGNKVSVMMFEGGHQVAPVDGQIKAFNWLLDAEDFTEL